MISDRLLRMALWATAAANLGVAGLITATDSALARFAGVPLPAPHPAYGLLLAMFIALFGLAYAWLARQQAISRAFVAFAAIGKTSAFAVTFALWLSQLVTGRWALLLGGDLLFAILFAAWLFGSARRAP
jgi:hypothetical protein